MSSGCTSLMSFIARSFLQSESLPVQPLLDGGERRGADAVDRRGETEAREQTAARPDHRQMHLGAVALLQDGAQLAQTVDQPQLQTSAAGPELAAEQRGVVALELAGAALAHPILEAVMDLGLQAMQALDILRL